MSQELNPHLKLINGWVYDFQDMIARRDTKEVSLMIRANGEVGRRYKHELRKFFDPPEDHFNERITEAYNSYVFEQQFLTSETK